MNSAKVYIVSSQDIFRAGVITITQNEPALELVGESARLDNAIRSIHAVGPDLIVLDLHECDVANDLSRFLREVVSYSTKAVVITSTSTDYELAQCIQNGIRGIISRNAARNELITAIRKVLSGRDHYCSHTCTKLRKESRSTSLTKRELEVLQLLAYGLTNKEIAERLVVGVGTIKTHLININSKLMVASRTEAVIRGVQQRLISI